MKLYLLPIKKEKKDIVLYKLVYTDIDKFDERYIVDPYNLSCALTEVESVAGTYGSDTGIRWHYIIFEKHQEAFGFANLIKNKHPNYSFKKVGD